MLLFLGYLIFFVYIPNLHDRKIYDKENIKNINENLDVISSKNKYDNYDNDDKDNLDDISKYKTKFDRNKIHKVLIDEGFKFDENSYYKKISNYIFIYFIAETSSFKVHYYINNSELFVINISIKYTNIIIEKHYDGNYEIEYIKIDEIKDCNLEKCETYLDYAMYINYIKKLISE